MKTLQMLFYQMQVSEAPKQDTPTNMVVHKPLSTAVEQIRRVFSDNLVIIFFISP